MRHLAATGITLLFILLFSSPSIGAEIRVTVEDSSGQSVRHAQVQLEDALGHATNALTDTAGQVIFDHLDAGNYVVSLLNQPGQIVTEPACGKFEIHLKSGQSTHVAFKIDIMGVSVDFGRPAGGGADDVPPLGDAMGTQAGEPFQFAMRIEHMDTVAHTPEQLILTGQFKMPEPEMRVVIDSVTSSKLYDFSETNVMFSQTASGILQVFFEVSSTPYLGIDGDTLIFYGRLLSRDPYWLYTKKNELCFCVQSLVFYHNGAPSSDPNLSKFAQSWSKCFRAKTLNTP